MIHSLIALTEKNHSLFLSHFIVQLIDLIDQNKAEVDASLLHALLAV